MAFDPLTAAMEFASTAIKRIWPDATEAEAAKLAALQAEMTAELQIILGQLQVNQAEASNPNWFVSGWRPAVGWSCALAFAYAYIIQPLLVFILAAVGHPITLPSLDISIMSTVLLGMLGLGGMRTFEKFKGVAR